jgi:hypothetical protein
MERLGKLAAEFRSAKSDEERKKIAKSYRNTWKRIVENGFDEVPPPEDMLPDDYMPKSFLNDIQNMDRKHVLYSSDGQGNWWRREWKPQCNEEVFMSDRCQGVKGHKDVHWSYRPCGSFAWDDNDDDPKHDGCSGTTPPDHKSYKTPLEMQDHYYLSHYEDSEVKDPAILAMLEKGDTPEDGASITRPLSEKESEKFKEKYGDRLK